MKPNDRLLMERRGGVMLLTLNDPDTRNALQPDIYRAGIQALCEARDDPEIGAIVLTGADGNFCSGGNLNPLLKNREGSRAESFQRVGLFHEWVCSIRQCPKPVIAAVEGSAAGAGFSIALACDLMVAAEDARFVMAYVKAGLSPDGGASAFLARAMAPQLMKEILLEGNAIDAGRLHQLGIVNRLTDKGRALDEALAWVAKLAAGPSNAMARIKRLAKAAVGNDVASQLDLEQEMFVESLYDAESLEGISAFFEKRPPSFAGELV